MSRFLERWSRLKKAAESASTADAIDAEKLLANLGPDSDFTVFLKEEVSEAVRRQAMKTLFADPHFNVMDGLDIYIDDYSISEPIPEAMMATLNQAKTLFGEPESPSEAPPSEAPSESTPAAPEAMAELPENVANHCDNLSAPGQNVPLADAGEKPQG